MGGVNEEEEESELEEVVEARGRESTFEEAKVVLIVEFPQGL